MRIALCALSLTLFVGAPAAQTTGHPGLNDLTINGLTSGSTSCGFVLATGLPMTFKISAAPLSPLAVFIDTCPCRAGTFPFPPNACLTFPTQSLDLGLGAGCVLINIPGATDASGGFSFTLGPCAFPFRFSTQALILDTACPPFLLTQAYQVSC